ncbi:DNA/RNA polymerase [Patellaria atrata CBS 101060]|uniref:DNA-directed RNA polymerase n=1 Tax=Patellaria atrata CBS 101060 TaxID=1346257 RepID=A0A9P4VMJ2_9PEZI|nr:DNA/RNA polymerase [Patellaria atrata CBS 101060]
MVRHATKRRLKHSTHAQLALAFEQLNLPWLCPAQIRWRTQATVATTDGKRNGTLRYVANRSDTRSIATHSGFFNSQVDNPPPLDSSLLPQPWFWQRPPPDISSLKPINPSEPLIIHDSIVAGSPSLRLKKSVGGDSVELHQNLYACLRVGRWDRATIILRRIGDLYAPNAPELISAHNSLFSAMGDALRSQRFGTTFSNIQDHFDELLASAIPADITTYTHVLRACLAVDEPKKERLVRQYMHALQMEGNGMYEALMTANTWSLAEWESLVKFQPQIFEPPSVTGEIEDRVYVEASTPSEADTTAPTAPDIRPVEQKGLGLKTLKKALSIFSDPREIPYPVNLEGTKEEKDRAYEYMRQDRLEEDAVDAAIERWKADNEKLQHMGINSALQTKSMESLLWSWYSSTLPAVKDELKLIRQALRNPGKKGEDRLVYGPYLEQLSAEKITAISLMATVSCFIIDREHSFTHVVSTTHKISKFLEEETNLQRPNKSGKPWHRNARSSSKDRLQRLMRLSRQPLNFEPAPETTDDNDVSRRSKEERHDEWPAVVKQKAGAILILKLLENCKMPVIKVDPITKAATTILEPAFVHEVPFRAGRKVGILTPHPKLEEKLAQEPMRGTFGLRLPMVVEPKPWRGWKEGGYLRYSNAIVRSKTVDETQQMYAVAAIEKGDMDQVFAGLDVLGRTAWKINRPVFEVMAEAWNSGEALASIAPLHYEYTTPPEPDRATNLRAHIEWKKEVKRLQNIKSGHHSQRCFQNLQLEIARAFLNEKFYFPHNVDFRGRAYPLPPILNHIGADFARGLLMFHKGKELGEIGLKWLKIHLANLYGFDKASFKEREEFAMNNMDMIRDSATNPLTGKRWWLKAEDPWQCLATCYELKNAYDCIDPTKYVSHLPVHQDGTCNGLQHYAALGGDSFGASQVNLEPSDRPQDIYSAVANLVRADVEEDARNGDKLAEQLLDKITRKVVKRTVMTNVYGVTFIGAKLQVHEELVKLFPDFKPTSGIPRTEVFAIYVARKIFEALGTLFTGAQKIQDWLGQCSNLITASVTPEQIERIKHQLGGLDMIDSKYKSGSGVKSQFDHCRFLSSVVWTTPLRMPVVQPYRSSKSKEILTALQSISIRQPQYDDPVSRIKQKQGFPPNFIHSLDATHMLLSALECDRLGLTFASVHDSFWTHAGDIPAMSKALRDAFVRMHSEDIIGRLKAEFDARYKGCLVIRKYNTESEIGKKIKALRLQKGSGQHKSNSAKVREAEELLEEFNRQKLLRSEDHEERKRGEQMVTPASIFLAETDPAAFIAPPKGGSVAQDATDESVNLEDRLEASAEAELSDATEADANVESVESDDVLTATDVDELEATSSDYQDIEKSADAADITETPNEDQIEKEQEDVRGWMVRKKAKKQTSKPAVSHLWLPLEFPPIPDKGDFDVTRLKQSQYFFS